MNTSSALAFDELLGHCARVVADVTEPFGVKAIPALPHMGVVLSRREYGQVKRPLRARGWQAPGFR